MILFEISKRSARVLPLSSTESGFDVKLNDPEMPEIYGKNIRDRVDYFTQIINFSFLFLFLFFFYCVRETLLNFLDVARLVTRI